jgi:hypothetical protein
MKEIAVAMICLVMTTAALGVTGCGKTTASNENDWQVSVEEATNVLKQAIAYAQAQDLEKLGVLAQDKSITRVDWELAGGWEAVPAEPPKIVDTYLLPTKHFENGSWATGGRVLVLEGVDGLGKHYRTESLVFRTGVGDSNLAMINVIYWNGACIGRTNEDGSGTTGPSQRPGANQ